MANVNTDVISPEQAIEATVAAYNSKTAIEKIGGLEASAREIDDSAVKKQTVLPNNIISKGSTILNFDALASWTISIGDESKVTIDNNINPFGTNALHIQETELGSNVTITTTTDLIIDLASDDYIDIPIYRPSYNNVSKVELQFFDGTNLYSNYLTTNNIKDKLVAYGSNTWHKTRFKIDDLVEVGTCSRLSTIKKVKILIYGIAGSLANIKIGHITKGTFNRRAITFSFDDCNETDYTQAYRILNSYGFSGTSFVVSSIIGDKTTQDFPKLDLVQMQEMYDNGWVFGIHGHYWTNWLSLSLVEAEASIKNCRDYLFNNGFKRGIKFCAYPENKYNDDIKNILAKYSINYARTTNYFLQQSPVEDFKEIKSFSLKPTLQENIDLIDASMVEGGLLNLYGHELYNGQSLKITVDIFEQVVDYINENYRRYVTTIPQWCKDYETGTTN